MKRETQMTPGGVRIPMPTRGEFMTALAKCARVPVERAEIPVDPDLQEHAPNG